MTDLNTLHDQLIRAIGAGDEEKIESTTQRVAQNASEDFPILHSALNALGYHNHLALLNEAMHIAWPQVQEAAAYSQTAVNAYAGRATDHLIYAYLYEQDAPDAPDQDLIQQLERYFPVDVERLMPYLQLLQGTVGRPWTLSDFESLSMQQLNGLMIEFQGYAHRHESVPFARTHLVRELLPRYFLDRAAGNLVPKMDVAAALRTGRKPFAGSSSNPEPKHPLGPDEVTLKLFLQRLLQTMDPQLYAAAAVLQLLPAWLRFLQFRNLLQESEAQEALHSLAGLGRSLAPYWDEHQDPALRHNVERWPSLLGDV
ncbi:MAG: hypothetical protein ACOC8X_11970 [Chloroflexota bacterium]